MSNNVSRDHEHSACSALDRPTVLTSALLALVDAGISTDVQALLIHGDASRGVKPNALGKAIESAFRAMVESQP